MSCPILQFPSSNPFTNLFFSFLLPLFSLQSAKYRSNHPTDLRDDVGHRMSVLPVQVASNRLTKQPTHRRRHPWTTARGPATRRPSLATHPTWSIWTRSKTAKVASGHCHHTRVSSTWRLICTTVREVDAR